MKSTIGFWVSLFVSKELMNSPCLFFNILFNHVLWLLTFWIHCIHRACFQVSVQILTMDCVHQADEDVSSAIPVFSRAIFSFRHKEHLSAFSALCENSLINYSKGICFYLQSCVWLALGFILLDLGFFFGVQWFFCTLRDCRQPTLYPAVDEIIVSANYVCTKSLRRAEGWVAILHIFELDCVNKAMFLSSPDSLHNSTHACYEKGSFSNHSLNSVSLNSLLNAVLGTHIIVTHTWAHTCQERKVCVMKTSVWSDSDVSRSFSFSQPQGSYLISQQGVFLSAL